MVFALVVYIVMTAKKKKKKRMKLNKIEKKKQPHCCQTVGLDGNVSAMFFGLSEQNLFFTRAFSVQQAFAMATSSDFIFTCIFWKNDIPFQTIEVILFHVCNIVDKAWQAWYYSTDLS